MVRIEIDWADFNKRLNTAMQGIAIDIQEALKNKLTKAHGKDTGALQTGIRAKVTSQTEITIKLPEHSIYLEFGTPGCKTAPAGLSPHPMFSAIFYWFGYRSRKAPLQKVGGKFEPLDELKDWARRKLGDPKKAEALAWHIYYHGSKPFPFIRSTFHKELPGIIRKNLLEAFH